MDDKEVQRELDPEKNASRRVPDTSERDFCRLATKRLKDCHTKNDKAIEQSQYENDFLVNGDHWPEKLRTDREKKGLPCLSLNHGIVHRDVVLGEMLQNMPRGKYQGKDNFSDPKLAEIGTGLARHVEDISKWDKVSEECVKQALTSGYPAFCVVSTDWIPGTFRQDIYIEHIPAQHSVFLDPYARNYHALPAQGGPKYGFIIRDIPKAEFTRDFPDASIPSTESLDEAEKDWWATETCRIADYYVAEPKVVTLLLFPGEVTVKEGSPEHKQMLEVAAQANIELKPEKTRRDTEYEIRLYKITSREILPDEEGSRDGAVVPSDFIPIVPWEGKYDYLTDGTKSYRGVFSNAIDANIMLSYHATLAAERAATGRQYKAPADVVGPYESEWQNPVGLGLLHYVPTAQHPTGPEEINTTTELAQAVQMMQYGNQEVKDLTNIHQSTLGMQGNETSGRAIMARQAQAASSNYEFPMHFKNAIEHLYRIMESMFWRVYDYKMAVRIIGDDGKLKDTVTINEPAHVDDGKGNMVSAYLNDVTKARFDTAVSIGPSFATQRQEASATMQAMAQGNPELGEILGDLLIQWQDIPGTDEASKRIQYILDKKYPGMIEASKTGGPEEDAIRQKIEQAIAPMQQQMAQAEQMMQGMQQAIGEAQAQIKQKDQENAALKTSLAQEARQRDLDKREATVSLREIELKAAEEKGTAVAGAQESSATQQVQMLASQVERLIDQQKELAAKVEDEKSGKASADDLTPLVTSLKDGMQAMADQIAKLAGPKKAVYDKSGKIVAAVPM